MRDHHRSDNLYHRGIAIDQTTIPYHLCSGPNRTEESSPLRSGFGVEELTSVVAKIRAENYMLTSAIKYNLALLEEPGNDCPLRR